MTVRPVPLRFPSVSSAGNQANLSPDSTYYAEIPLINGTAFFERVIR